MKKFDSTIFFKDTILELSGQQFRIYISKNLESIALIILFFTLCICWLHLQFNLIKLITQNKEIIFVICIIFLIGLSILMKKLLKKIK